jgi:hypothetical protein
MTPLRFSARFATNVGNLGLVLKDLGDLAGGRVGIARGRRLLCGALVGGNTSASLPRPQQ